MKPEQSDLPTRADELLAALRCARLAHMNGQTCSLTWIKERRIIMKEAEILGLTDELLARAGEA